MGSGRSFCVQVRSNRGEPSGNRGSDIFPHYDGSGDFKINPSVDRNDDGDTHGRGGRLDEDGEKHSYDEKDQDRAEPIAIELLDEALNA